MDRRRFLLTSVAGAVAMPLAAGAQQAGKVYRIGFLSPQTPTDPEVSPLLGIFLQALRNLRYAEGWNIAMEYRWAERAEWFPDFALELVRLKVDVIVATSPPAALAAKNATRTIPIVTVLGGWHVGSLARPSDNVTGLTSIAVELGPKLLELLREAVPKVSRVAVLANPANQVYAPQLREVEIAARVLGVQLQLLEVRGSEEFDSAFAAMTRGRADALLVLSDAIFWNHRTQIADLAAKSRLPAIYGRPEHVEAGGLMAYAPSNADLLRRAATYVAKILKGAKSADRLTCPSSSRQSSSCSSTSRPRRRSAWRFRRRCCYGRIGSSSEPSVPPPLGSRADRRDFASTCLRTGRGGRFLNWNRVASRVPSNEGWRPGFAIRVNPQHTRTSSLHPATYPL